MSYTYRDLSILLNNVLSAIWFIMVSMVMVAMVMVAMVMVYYACYETSIFIGSCIDTLHSLLPSFSAT